MLIEDHKDTYNSQFAFAALEDIDRRSELAVQRHPEVFDDIGHQSSVAEVEAICKKYFAAYGKIYCTARPATRKRPAHTEVKVCRYVLRANRDSNKFKTDLNSTGAKQIVWKHNTESVSIHVW
jgi:hypothetical protein